MKHSNVGGGALYADDLMLWGAWRYAATAVDNYEFKMLGLIEIYWQRYPTENTYKWVSNTLRDTFGMHGYHISWLHFDKIK